MLAFSLAVRFVAGSAPPLRCSLAQRGHTRGASAQLGERSSSMQLGRAWGLESVAREDEVSKVTDDLSGWARYPSCAPALCQAAIARTRGEFENNMRRGGSEEEQTSSQQLSISRNRGKSGECQSKHDTSTLTASPLHSPFRGRRRHCVSCCCWKLHSRRRRCALSAGGGPRAQTRAARGYHPRAQGPSRCG